MSDDQARRDIITNVNRNYFVEAGAGSGKTTMLVERMVAMVEQGIPAEKICTITFTKAAANEFYARFQKRLSERSADEHRDQYHPGQLTVQTEETRERCRKALLNIDSCFMGTIDSFCNMILSEHPLEASIPANSTVVEEADIVDRYLQEYSRIMVSDDYADLREKFRIFVNTQRDPEKVFREVLTATLSVRDADFVYEKPQFASVDRQFARDRADLIELLDKLQKNPDIAYRKQNSGERDPEWDVLEDRFADLAEASWDSRFTFVLDTLKKIRDLRVRPFEGIAEYFGASFRRLDPHESRGKISWYELAAEGFRDVLETLTDYQATIALDFTVECMRTMSGVMRKQGSLSFFDYKLYLRDMLREDAGNGHKLIDHIFSRHSYFLIDEFQDTDPMQAEIFFYLAAQQFDSDWKKCIAHPGSLFIVGDPKQSIYRFKNADVASFKKVRSLFSGRNGEVLKLTSNFRSTLTLHRWFNTVFGEHLLNADTEDQSRYEMITNRDQDDGFVTGVYRYRPENVKDDSPEVLEMISTLVGNPEILIGNGKAIRYKDIMIITSGKAQLNRYVKAFTQNHVPFRVEGDIDFNECPALCDLVSVFRAVVYPDSGFYLYDALNSRVFGITPEVLMAIRADIRNMKSGGVFDPDNESVKKKTELLNRLSARSRNISPSALMSEMIDELRIFAVSGTRNTEYVYYVLELLREREASGEISCCQDAVSYLNDLMSNKTRMERCVSLEKNDDRVHLANLHKVKGLEAPVVILAGTRKTAARRSPSKRVEYSGDEPKCYMLLISSDDNKVYLPYKDRFGKKDREAISAEAERIRQLYVAATRAGRILIIADENPWKDLSQFVSQDFTDAFAVRKPQPFVPEKADGQILYDKSASIIRNDSLSRQSSVSIHKPSDIEFETVTERIETVSTKRNPKLIGTLVHRMMEIIVSSADSADQQKLIGSLCASLDTPDDHYYSDILRRVWNTVHQGGYPQANGTEPDILSELLSADEAYCEIPFSFRDGENSVTTGIIDVLYRRGEQWFVVDYKTNADEDDLDEKYLDQLNEYRKVVSRQTGKEAYARVYHINVEGDLSQS